MTEPTAKRRRNNAATKTMSMNPIASFEGKCGPSVEKLPQSFEGLGEDDYFILTQKYGEDDSYRATIGPNICMYAECDWECALYGLQIDIDFGTFGNIRGICKEGKKVCWSIEWRCGPNYDQKSAFFSEHNDGEEVIALYFHAGRDKLANFSWYDPKYHSKMNMNQTALDFLSTVKAAPKGTKFVNWRELELSDFENINDEDKWRITLSMLNDPQMAHFYGRPSDAYPTLALLTVYTIDAMKYESGGNLPIMITKENEQLFKLADNMCRQVSGGGGGTGYGNLIGFERIVEKINKDYPPAKAKEDYDTWNGGYARAQALMLVLSREFEEAMWDYDMVDDPERVYELVANFLRVFGSYMQPACAPSDAAREQLKKDLDFNDKHLKAGVFVSFAEDECEELFASTFAKCVKNDEENE